MDRPPLPEPFEIPLPSVYRRAVFKPWLEILATVPILTLAAGCFGLVPGWLVRGILLPATACVLVLNSLRASRGKRMIDRACDSGLLICTQCGYDLRSISPCRCPECGWRFSPDETRFAWSKLLWDRA